MNIIETKNLSFSYDGINNALSNISIAIKKNSVTAILGGNGAGKSTLFLNLNGVLKPQQGEVFFGENKVVFDTKGIKQMRGNVGIVFQDPNDQLFSASVRNDIAFGALNMGQTNEQAAILVEHMAQLTGVADLLERPTHSLSYGQKKRVAIAGVLVMKPALLILDEPTAGLDPMGVSSILTLLMKIKEETGTTIAIATHDIDIVPLYCDNVYVLHQGKVVLSGTPAQVFQQKSTLRAIGLRIPRIAHLMEILKDKDGIDVDITAATISQARHSIKELAVGYAK